MSLCLEDHYTRNSITITDKSRVCKEIKEATTRHQSNRGEPIVASPEDAFRCFMGSNLDFLAVGNCIMRKAEQHPSLARSYEQAFELD